MTILAFDRGSVRSYDGDGRMHVARTPISKATVNGYYGREIPGYIELGLDPDLLYQLLRDPDELAAAAATFCRLPILSKHVQVTLDAPQKELVIGTIGSDVNFDGKYLQADLTFWDALAIAGIESESIIELSCAYYYVPDMTPGEFEGMRYDGRMTQIRGNHLALVEVGRAGPDVLVADAAIKPRMMIPMKMTKLGRALFAALSAISPAFAADAAGVESIVKDVTGSSDKAALRAAILAKDSSLDPQQIDGVIDTLLDVEQSPTPVEPKPAAADETPADKARAMLAGKVDDDTLAAVLALLAPPAAADSDDDKDDAIQAAMDSLRADLRAAHAAALHVRPTVGDVTMDSAGEIYSFALKHLGVDHDGVTDAKALRAMYTLAVKPAASAAPAQDAKPATKPFPNVDRFGRA